VWPGDRGARRPADRDRGRDEVRVLERVQGDPEGGRIGQRLDPQLDEVGGIVGVDRVGRVGVGAVGRREQIAVAEVAARVAARIGRVSELLGPVVVVEEVLVEKLAAAVRARAGDQDRRRFPDAGVLQLRRIGKRRVEDVRTGPGARPLVQRRRVGERRTAQPEPGACDRDR
jgi:hypothetical protein